MHIGHGATVTARMPTTEEVARGFPEGAPVMVVSNGANTKIVPHWVTLEFDDPHGQAAPDAVNDAARYVLRIISEQMQLTNGRIVDLAAALGQSPCHVGHLADEVRDEEDAAWQCADASMCERVPQPADGAAPAGLPAIGPAAAAGPAALAAAGPHGGSRHPPARSRRS
jgi:hypothetical protein